MLKRRERIFFTHTVYKYIIEKTNQKRTNRENTNEYQVSGRVKSEPILSQGKSKQWHLIGGPAHSIWQSRAPATTTTKKHTSWGGDEKTHRFVLDESHDR